MGNSYSENYCMPPCSESSIMCVPCLYKRRSGLIKPPLINGIKNPACNKTCGTDANRICYNCINYLSL